MDNTIPGIENYTDIFNNPVLHSPNSNFDLPFYSTRDSLMDVELYRRFLENAMSRFRKSRRYKHYKGYLYSLGLDRCQFNGNITSEMAEIEMHHNIINLFDIALIVTENTLNTVGYISTFDLVQMLKDIHSENLIPVTMLSVTSHQLVTVYPEIFTSSDMVAGKWQLFLSRYKNGITKDIAYKLITYINRELESNGPEVESWLDLRSDILDWSVYNDN